MSRWFRLYDELVDDPKVQMLPDRMFRALINLWCLASRNDGALPPIEEAAFSLRMKPAQLSAIIVQLKQAGLFEDVDGVTQPHNWAGRQFRSDVSNERVKRHRKRRGNVTSAVTGNGSVTPPETETETETETENKHTPPSLRSGGAPARFELEPEPELDIPASLDRQKYPDEFEALWHEYRPIAPKNATKSDAFSAWKKLSAAERDLCWSGLVEYAVWVSAERKRRPDTPVKHLATFINKRGWETFMEQAQ